jgi:multidrug resistance protein
MPTNRSPLAIIFVTVFIDLIGFGIVIPVLPLYAERYGASETVVGLLLGVYSAMQFVFAPLLGRLSDRVGRRPVLLVSLIGTSLSFLVLGFAHTLWLLFLARAIDGITGGNISTAQAYIADVTPPEQRSRGMGLIGAAFGLGFIFGPAIGGILSRISLGAPFFFASALAAANATALYFRLPESLSPEKRRAGERSSIARVLESAGSWNLGAVMAAYFLATLSFAMLTATYALFANERFGFDATHTGYMFTYLGVIGAVIQGGLLGRLAKAFGDRPLAVTGTAVFAASMFLLPTSPSFTTLLLASTGIAIGNSLMTPTLNSIASKSVSAAAQGRVLGAMASAASLARIIGPVLGGWLLGRDAVDHAAHYGRSPYWTSGIIMLGAFLLAVAIRASAATAVKPTEG